MHICEKLLEGCLGISADEIGRLRQGAVCHLQHQALLCGIQHESADVLTEYAFRCACGLGFAVLLDQRLALFIEPALCTGIIKCFEAAEIVFKYARLDRINADCRCCCGQSCKRLDCRDCLCHHCKTHQTCKNSFRISMFHRKNLLNLIC